MDDTNQTPNSNTQDPNNVQSTNTNNQNAKAAADDLAKLTEKPTESLSDIVEDFEEAQHDYQAMYKAGGKFAKQLEEIAAGQGRKGGVEMEPKPVSEKAVEAMEEIPTRPEIEKKPELTGFMEESPKHELPEGLVEEYTNQVHMNQAGQVKGKVKLPLTQDQIQKGLHEQVWESIRWLAEWCQRQILILKDRILYKDQTT